MIADEACWERGCACHDSRDSPGVELVKKRQWVGLTDEQLDTVYFCVESGVSAIETWHEQARAIEAKLKERNNG